MSSHLGPLLQEIQDLEKLVANKIHGTTKVLPLEFKNGKAVFSDNTRKLHKSLAKNVWKYFRDSSLLTIVTAPIIYSILLPISMLDLLVCLYQWICFPVYRIPRVRRADYVVLDRHRLAYLNVVERLNCVYCGYSNGVLAFAREVASRTEQYWCPIKHARRAKGCHARQCLFCEYGDAEGFRHEYEELRKQFDAHQ